MTTCKPQLPLPNIRKIREDQLRENQLRKEQFREDQLRKDQLKKNLHRIVWGETGKRPGKRPGKPLSTAICILGSIVGIIVLRGIKIYTPEHAWQRCSITKRHIVCLGVSAAANSTKRHRTPLDNTRSTKCQQIPPNITKHQQKRPALWASLSLLNYGSSCGNGFAEAILHHTAHSAAHLRHCHWRHLLFLICDHTLSCKEHTCY